MLRDEAYHLVDRLDILGITPRHLPTDLKPYPREQVALWLSEADTAQMTAKEKAWLHRARYRIDDSYVEENERGVLQFFFRNRRDLLHYHTENFRVYLNPQVYGGLGFGQANFTAANQPDESRTLFRNTRGATLRGSVFKKVGFYGEFSDNQLRYPQFFHTLADGRQAVPGAGFYKAFNEDGYDFLLTKGYLTYSPIEQLRFKFGRDRTFYGQGVQSLQFSDHATDRLLFDVMARFWKLEYHTNYSQMVDYIPGKPDNFGAHPKKYATVHNLYFRPTKNISLGLFESIIFASQLPNQSRGFELNYLNPLIFYRAIEQYNGSPENGAMGANFKVNFLQKFQTYGQIMLDDFNVSQTRESDGWWGNKYGLQLGLKYIDAFGLATLDLQLEANHLRPYLYAHYNVASNYMHYNQAMAHPLGANLQELIGVVRYRPLSRLNMELQLASTAQGRDAGNLNYGSNPLLSDITHDNGEANPDFGNETLQGERWNQFRANLRVSYELFLLNAFVDLDAFYRQESFAGNDFTNYAVLLSLRWHISRMPFRF